MSVKGINVGNQIEVSTWSLFRFQGPRGSAVAQADAARIKIQRLHPSGSLLGITLDEYATIGAGAFIVGPGAALDLGIGRWAHYNLEEGSGHPAPGGMVVPVTFQIAVTTPGEWVPPWGGLCELWPAAAPPSFLPFTVTAAPSTNNVIPPFTTGSIVSTGGVVYLGAATTYDVKIHVGGWL